ncbi:hypothetical protein [Mycetocola spongiae]|uniref:hypothetical protein n=1 Tax=Mycetocola spongiae TaxID=2859226 RepID=UPI001CF35B86|nr:hypothetical protein [Mycetocola spongiae]UCR89551.1 hypothetical protein KXZ72_02315 [Mycetocola spongiae]
MSGTRTRPGAGFLACLIAPLAAGVLLNALIRPGLARALGGERHSTGAGVRSNNVLWTFDPDTTAEHPILTALLTPSDGAVAAAMLALTALLLTGHWLITRRRPAREAQEG